MPCCFQSEGVNFFITHLYRRRVFPTYKCYLPSHGLHTWAPPVATASGPSEDRDEEGRGLSPTGVAGWGWPTCDGMSSDSQRSSSSLISRSIWSRWPSGSRPRRSSWKKETKHESRNVVYLFQHSAGFSSNVAVTAMWVHSCSPPWPPPAVDPAHLSSSPSPAPWLPASRLLRRSWTRCCQWSAPSYQRVSPVWDRQQQHQPSIFF